MLPVPFRLNRIPRTDGIRARLRTGSTGIRSERALNYGVRAHLVPSDL